MPSGSCGGGGGSHGGGGGGGSHFGNSGVSSRPSTPMRFRRHGVYYVIPAGPAGAIRSNLMIIGFFFVFILMFAFAITMSAIQISTVKKDNAKYIAMIEYALEHEERIREGEITGIHYNEDAGKYYFTYKIRLDDDTDDLDNGYTYSVYSNSEINQFRVGDKLDFAIDKDVVDYTTDSINLGYKDIPIENDGEYANAKRSLIIISCLAFAFIIVIVMLSVSTVKKYKNSKQVLDAEKDANGEYNANTYGGRPEGFLSADDVFFGGSSAKNVNENSEANSVENSERDKQKKVVYCKYCGAKMEDGERKCKNCGSIF